MDNKTYTLWKLTPVALRQAQGEGEPVGDGAGAVILGEHGDKGDAHRAFAAAIAGLAAGETLQVVDDAGTLWWSHDAPPAVGAGLKPVPTGA